MCQIRKQRKIVIDEIMTKTEILDIKTTLEKIVENLFLCEPLMFATYCTHVLTINPKITVPIRSGKMRIEYNPVILETMKFCQCRREIS